MSCMFCSVLIPTYSVFSALNFGHITARELMVSPDTLARI